MMVSVVPLSYHPPSPTKRGSSSILPVPQVTTAPESVCVPLSPSDVAVGERGLGPGAIGVNLGVRRTFCIIEIVPEDTAVEEDGGAAAEVHDASGVQSLVFSKGALG